MARPRQKTRLRKKTRYFDVSFKVPRYRKSAFDVEQRKLDYEFKLRMESLCRKEGECHEEDPDSGVVFLKNFPHAFAEAPMKKFFSQFGRIKRLRISRNKKTGYSKGFAYIEFEFAEVAKIVAETMNNYLMFRQIMKCEFVPKEKLHPKTFKGCFRKSFKPMSRGLNIKRTNKCVMAKPAKVCKQLKRKATKEIKKQKMLAEMGIDYEITGHYRDGYAEIKSKLEKTQQAARLEKEAAIATLLENMEELIGETDESEREDVEDYDSEGESDDESETKTFEEFMENISTMKGNKRKMETDRDEAINKARKVQKEMENRAESESKEMDQNEVMDEEQKAQKLVKSKAQSESEEDSESFSSSESDISTEEEEPTNEEPTTKKPPPKFITPEEANKKGLVTLSSKKQRLVQQEPDSTGKEVGSKSRLNAEKMTPFKGSKSIAKATPKSVGKKPVPKKSFKRDQITPPKGQRPTMDQTSKSMGKKSTVRSRLDTDLVTPTKEGSLPEQQIFQSTGKKSESKDSFEKEVVTPAAQPPVKKTSKSTGRKGTVKRTKLETTTPGKGQRSALQKTSKSTGKKDFSKRRALKSS
ncbi:MKI67 FHA domain-interacting nucleolar phosphoprotein-like [Holothuria leucospilota]|uniref:MKI67 FHA domain-interacting nucleolar phosphoprotein-like n=1 Tax=Holothuria leucospilota TaxID=206669 RepID=A0A9Q1C0S5_HOLLE|nr:MKI67 FHA domain-interacting nucleolar phosphoprotein-like [Holothuria leucospilota]